MSIESIVTDEIRQMVGRQTMPQPAVDVVTTSELRRWANATLDDNRLWYDDAYAQRTRFGMGCVPGPFPMRAVGHFRSSLGTPDPVRHLDFDDDFRHGSGSFDEESIKIEWPEGVGAFHAGNEVEYFQLPRIGDRISVMEKIVGIEEKVGRSGKLAVVHVDAVFSSQDGQVLMVNHHVSIAREMPTEAWKVR